MPLGRPFRVVVVIDALQIELLYLTRKIITKTANSKIVCLNDVCDYACVHGGQRVTHLKLQRPQFFYEQNYISFVSMTETIGLRAVNTSIKSAVPVVLKLTQQLGKCKHNFTDRASYRSNFDTTI
jgi:hypothetical protein